MVAQLCSPPHRLSFPSLNADLWCTLQLYLLNPSEATDKANCTAFMCHSPYINLPSYYRTTCLISEIIGIVLVIHYICINLCIMYTSPFLNLKACPMCLELWYNQFKLWSSVTTAPWHQLGQLVECNGERNVSASGLG